MKNITLFIIQFSLAVVTMPLLGQGTFENLDFEQANPVFVNPRLGGYVTTDSAIPDWTAEIGGVTQTQILENGFSLGAPEVSLLTANVTQPPIDGNYSILLTGSASSASISQTGEIPVGSQSLLFDAEPGSGPLVVTVGNDSLTLFPIRTGPNFEVYGANISAWSGQTEQIMFSASQNSTRLNNWEIDDISFSPNPITVTPEPDALTLMSVGGLLFGLYRRFQSTRK